jgi:hypothetical protein
MLIPFTPARQFFKAVNLPVPSSKGYWCNPADPVGAKKIVFLSRYGLVINFTRRHRVVRRYNPHFITALFTRETPLYQITIRPGVQMGAQRGAPEAFSRYLKEKYGVIDKDAGVRNLGYIPSVDSLFPILIDLDAKYIKVKKDAPWEQTPQEALYAPLKAIMNKAWPQDQKMPDQGGVRDFFAACAEFKAQGKLLSPWEKSCWSMFNESEMHSEQAHRYDWQIIRHQMRQDKTARLAQVI